MARVADEKATHNTESICQTDSQTIRPILAQHAHTYGALSLCHTIASVTLQGRTFPEYFHTVE